MFFTEALVKLASNTNISLSAKEWPAAVTLMFGACVWGGLAGYGIHKHYEYKKMTVGLDDVEHLHIEGPGK